jgi:hypothetical protein
VPGGERGWAVRPPRGAAALRRAGRCAPLPRGRAGCCAAAAGPAAERRGGPASRAAALAPALTRGRRPRRVAALHAKLNAAHSKVRLRPRGCGTQLWWKGGTHTVWDRAVQGGGRNTGKGGIDGGGHDRRARAGRRARAARLQQSVRAVGGGGPQSSRAPRGPVVSAAPPHLCLQCRGRERRQAAAWGPQVKDRRWAALGRRRRRAAAAAAAHGLEGGGRRVAGGGAAARLAVPRAHTQLQPCRLRPQLALDPAVAHDAGRMQIMTSQILT